MSNNGKKSLLILIPEIPYPLRAHGISIRYLPIIQEFWEEYNIDLIIVSKSIYADQDIKELQKFCRKVSIIKIPDPNDFGFIYKLKKRLFFYFPYSLPRSWVIYGSEKIKCSISKAVNNERYSILLCVTGFLHSFVNVIEFEKLIVDFIDSPSLLTKRNVIGSDRSFLIKKLENYKTQHREYEIIRDSDSSIYISDYDSTFVKKGRKYKNKIFVIPNGFSPDGYKPDTIESIKSPSIGFLGNMSYYPNVESVHWLYDNVFLTLKKEIPALSLWVIGRQPDESILELGEKEGVNVTGDVESIWPYVNSIDVFIFSLQRGAGLKNKILEVMYATKPVITSHVGNEGIDAISGEQLYICETKSEYISAARDLFSSGQTKQKISENGRKHIVKKFQWENILKDFGEILKSVSM